MTEMLTAQVSLFPEHLGNIQITSECKHPACSLDLCINQHAVWESLWGLTYRKVVCLPKESQVCG